MTYLPADVLIRTTPAMHPTMPQILEMAAEEQLYGPSETPTSRHSSLPRSVTSPRATYLKQCRRRGTQPNRAHLAKLAHDASLQLVNLALKGEIDFAMLDELDLEVLDS